MNTASATSAPRKKRRSGFELLELLDERFDAMGDFSPLADPLPLLFLQRRQLLKQRRRVLPLQLVVNVLTAAGQFVALALELRAIVAQLLHQGRGALHALRQPVEIGCRHRRCLVHRVLNWPPITLATAATIRSWRSWISPSVSVRSGFWKRSA